LNPIHHSGRHIRRNLWASIIGCDYPPNAVGEHATVVTVYDSVGNIEHGKEESLCGGLG